MNHIKWKMGMIKRTCHFSYQKKRLSGDGYSQTDVCSLCLMVHPGLGTVGKVMGTALFCVGKDGTVTRDNGQHF